MASTYSKYNLQQESRLHRENFMQAVWSLMCVLWAD